MKYVGVLRVRRPFVRAAAGQRDAVLLRVRRHHAPAAVAEAREEVGFLPGRVDAEVLAACTPGPPAARGRPSRSAPGRCPCPSSRAPGRCRRCAWRSASGRAPSGCAQSRCPAGSAPRSGRASAAPAGRTRPPAQRAGPRRSVSTAPSCARLRRRRLEVGVRLAQVRRVGSDVPAVVLQPVQDHRRVQAAAIRQHRQRLSHAAMITRPATTRLLGHPANRPAHPEASTGSQGVRRDTRSGTE